eukprot:7782389-Pyramimonas_sp.AAC.1
MSHAFATSTPESMDITVGIICADYDAEMCRQRYRHSVIEIPTRGARCVAQPRQRGTMGDPSRGRSWDWVVNAGVRTRAQRISSHNGET